MQALAIKFVIESILNSNEQVKCSQRLNSIDRDELCIELDFGKMRRRAFIWLAIWIVQIISLLTIVLVGVFGDDSITTSDKVMMILYVLVLAFSITSMRYFQLNHYIGSLGVGFELFNQHQSAEYW